MGGTTDAEHGKKELMKFPLERDGKSLIELGSLEFV